MSVLEAQLESPDAATRAAAAWSLAGLQDAEQRTIAKLESLLDDPEQQVRYAVAWALGHLSDADNYFDAPAKPVRMPQPHYPKEAFRNRTEGTVLIEILVGEHGEIAHRETRRSVATLDAAALASIDQWTFLPATAGERPVASLARAPVTFRIY